MSIERLTDLEQRQDRTLRYAHVPVQPRPRRGVGGATGASPPGSTSGSRANVCASMVLDLACREKNRADPRPRRRNRFGCRPWRGEPHRPRQRRWPGRFDHHANRVPGSASSARRSWRLAPAREDVVVDNTSARLSFATSGRLRQMARTEVRRCCLPFFPRRVRVMVNPSFLCLPDALSHHLEIAVCDAIAH